MLVGEVPGDREDREGRPFVGPAGRELDRALEAAGIERGDVYLTNAVKHFKFEERGKRRIHQTPKKGEVDACLPWLDTEIKLVKPTAVVTLGATAAKALHGSSFRAHAAPRRAARLRHRGDRGRHDPPVGDPAQPRRRGAARGARGARGRPADRRRGARGPLFLTRAAGPGRRQRRAGSGRIRAVVAAEVSLYDPRAGQPPEFHRCGRLPRVPQFACRPRRPIGAQQALRKSWGGSERQGRGCSHAIEPLPPRPLLALPSLRISLRRVNLGLVAVLALAAGLFLWDLTVSG